MVHQGPVAVQGFCQIREYQGILFWPKISGKNKGKNEKKSGKFLLIAILNISFFILLITLQKIWIVFDFSNHMI